MNMLAIDLSIDLSEIVGAVLILFGGAVLAVGIHGLWVSR